jgi:hypothetical protein
MWDEKGIRRFWMVWMETVTISIWIKICEKEGMISYRCTRSILSGMT